MRALILLFAVLLSSIGLFGQDGSVPTSMNGWQLSPQGTIRILVLFAEVEYDKDPSKDPQPDGAAHWPKGQLPKQPPLKSWNCPRNPSKYPKARRISA